MPLHPPAEVLSRLFGRISAIPWFKKYPEIFLPERLLPISESDLFHREGFRVLELGCGWGEFAGQWLQERPQDSYIAFELKKERIVSAIAGVRRTGCKDFRILPLNYSWFLNLFPTSSVDLIIVNFPDPWPKKRHWKHRLVDMSFPEAAKKILRPGGEVYLATDYGPYARKILGVFRSSPDFSSVYPWPHYRREKEASIPGSRFERIQTEQMKRPYYQKWMCRK